MIRPANICGKSVRSRPNRYDNSAAKITTAIRHSTYSDYREDADGTDNRSDLLVADLLADGMIIDSRA